MNKPKIKFANENDKEFTKTLREEVKEYFRVNNISQFSNFNMVAKTIFMFALYFGPYTLMVTNVFTNPWMIFLLWIIMGFGMAGIGLSIMHDANHNSYSKHQGINSFLALTLNLLGGYTRNWQYQHNTMHHSYTNIDGYDEDIDPGKVLRFSPHKPLLKHHRYQHIYAWFLYGLMTVTWSINKDFKQLIRYKKEGVILSSHNNYTLHFAEMLLSKVVYYTYLLVIPILVVPLPWWLIVIFYFVMHFICGFTLGIIFQTAHVMPSSKYPEAGDEGSIENNWTIHQLATTTNYSPRSRLMSWYVGGLNYQVEHHLFPNICHVHYRHLSPIVNRVAEQYNIQYHVQPDFFTALRNHYRMLRTLGTE